MTAKVIPFPKKHRDETVYDYNARIQRAMDKINDIFKVKKDRQHD